ncbi:restriction endonuclease subunit S [Helicobacter pylori]|uniref:restriction endonuclease subunit S n=1 Tax=Helicobacter pylori TaxID=210 RepID=UPI00264833DF|nr:restriction endonuclease subunit S [Helicobacter pylori]MCQ2940371.1 restriction endonuclease subunit S [Helicobacter pylori]
MDALTTPLNWQRVRLGDICEFGNGGAYETLIVENGNFKLISLNSIDIDGNLKNTMKQVNFYDNSLKQDDIVMVLSDVAHGDFLGLCAVIPSNDYVLNQRMGRLRKRNDCINILFLRLYINANQKYFKMQGQGSSQLNLSKKAIEDFEILLPPLNEQIAIANILSDVDHYLYSLDALILKKESVKKALSFELLSQRKRLKGFNQAWQKVRLGDICEFGNGGAYETLIVENGNFKLISLNSIDIDGNLKNTMKQVNFYDNSLKQDDIVMVLSDVAHGDFLGLCAVIPSNDYVLNQRMGRLRKRNDCINILFLRLYINANQKYFKMQGQGSSQLNLSKKAIEDFEILLPPLNEQIAIANILSGLDHEIISLKNKKRQFENIKKALNHDLMSAKIRVLKK